MFDLKCPLKVFLYHAPADRSVVRDLYLRLIKDGVDAWLVKERLLPGQDWKQEIQNAAREADVGIVCVSKQFHQRESRQREMRAAFASAMEQLADELFIIPVRLEECDPLETLEKWQWVNLFEEAGYETLTRALEVRADELGATLEKKESFLPEIITSSMKHQESIAEEKPVEASQRVLEIAGGAGILIEGAVAKPHKPGTALILSLLGFAAILMMAMLGPSWIEKAAQLMPGAGTSKTSMSGTKTGPAILFPFKATPTSISKGEVSIIVFLVDRSSSMDGQRITNVKSALADFISQLDEKYFVSVMEFDTNVELRTGLTRDRAAARDAIQSITVDVNHNGSCLRDALYAGMQEVSLIPAANDIKNMTVVLTGVGIYENSTGLNCNVHFTEDISDLRWEHPVSIFDIHVSNEENISSSKLVYKLDLNADMEGATFIANNEPEIDRALLWVSKQAGLKLDTESITFPLTPNSTETVPETL